MPPRYFESAADVNENIVLGTTTESLHLDFKASIDGFGARDAAKEEGQQEACRDITQFANQFGGCLLIGLAETKRQDNIKIADKLTPVKDPDGLRAWLEQAITNYCIPSTFNHQIEFIRHDMGILVAVNVPPSVVPVFLWNKKKNTMQVVGRNNHGKQYLNPDDVERLRMNGSRAAKIAFDSLTAPEKSQEVELVPGLLQWSNSNQSWSVLQGENKPRVGLGTCSDASFNLQIFHKRSSGSTTVTVPYGLVQECWKNVEDRLCIMLQLDLGILVNGTVTFVRR